MSGGGSVARLSHNSLDCFKYSRGSARNRVSGIGGGVGGGGGGGGGGGDVSGGGCPVCTQPSECLRERLI